ncbi:hypothetical protein [Arsenicibacter rosenii]|uniref:Uncharacterized protein n=1 Tax=Arsenicibacter rosenii TaxID=1750698 RepID=A0A1S2VLY1_9BACT|nr:hypothetical protein [Arsenicibacter rosenii]OIN59787.1 hypothetical protein BLX24_07985 [Arsenicibacter rosenii]
MKFKIMAGTETYARINAIAAEIKRCQREAIAVTEELGGSGYYGEVLYVDTGITAITCEQPPAWPYKRVRKRGHGAAAYFPRNVKANQAILERIRRLPKVHQDQLNQAIGFVAHCVDDRYFFSFGLLTGKDFHLVSIDERADYTPLPDMSEITVSEYKQLREQGGEP